MSKDAIFTEQVEIDSAEKIVGKTRSALKSNRLIVALILALTFFAFAETIRYKFVFDDFGQIVENPLIKSWSHAPGYLTSHVWVQEYPGSVGNYYRPAFLFWMLVNYMMFGLNPSGWHLTTVAIHVCVTLLVYLLARRLLKDHGAACMTAIVFGLHPVHIEAVAWVSGVTEPLLALFFISAFLFYLNWRDLRPSIDGATAEPSEAVATGLVSSRKRNRALHLAASLALYSIAMLAKETALVFPALIIAYELAFGSSGSQAASFFSRTRDAIKSAAPYLILSVIYLTARVMVLKALGHAITPLPILTIVMTWPSVLWTYMKMLIWPVGLSAFYDTPYVTSPGLANFALPLLAILFAAVLLRLWSRAITPVRFACALLVLPILPVLNLSAFYTGENAHDRYLYLPSIGFSILVALALKSIPQSRMKLVGQPAFKALAAIVLAAMLGLATSAQNVYWASNLLLYYRGVSVAPNNPIAANNLANEMVEREMYDEAIALYHKALEHDPTYWRASYNLGWVYYKLGRYEEAELNLVRSMELNRLDSDTFTRLALTQMKLGRFDEADSLLRQAIAMSPKAAGYHYALGIILKQKGDTQGAISEFQAELANNPNQEAARAQMAELTSNHGSTK